MMAADTTTAAPVAASKKVTILKRTSHTTSSPVITTTKFKKEATSETTCEATGVNNNKLSKSQVCNQSVNGGDMEQSLDAEELDRITKQLGVETLPADSMYYAQRIEDASERAAKYKCLGDQLKELAMRNGPTPMALHVSTEHFSHWASAVIEHRGGQEYQVTILDSAPHPATARIMRNDLSKMGFHPSKVICHRRQPRNSFECGLHFIWFVLWTTWSPSTIPKSQHAKLDYINLKPWRDILKGAMSENISRSKMIRTLLDACPEVEHLMRSNNYNTLKCKVCKGETFEKNASYVLDPYDCTGLSWTCKQCHNIEGGGSVDTRPRVRQNPSRRCEACGHSYQGTQCSHCESVRLEEEERFKKRQTKLSARNTHVSSAPVATTPPAASNNGKPHRCAECSRQVSEIAGGLCIRCFELNESRRTLVPPLPEPELAFMQLVNRRSGLNQKSRGAEVSSTISKIYDTPLSIEEYLPRGHNFSINVVKGVKSFFATNLATLKNHKPMPGWKHELRIGSLPDHLQGHVAFMEVAVNTARAKMQCHENHYWREAFECYSRGSLLHTTVTDQVMESAIQQRVLRDEWGWIGSEGFHRYAISEETSSISEQIKKDKVALVLNIPGHIHFVAVRFENGTIYVKDSLFSDLASHVNRATGEMDCGSTGKCRTIHDYLARFRSLLQENGKVVSNKVIFESCSQQEGGSNDCGVESIVNSIMAVSGQPRERVAFSRGEIRRAYEHYSRNPNKEYRFEFLSKNHECKAVPIEGVGKQGWCSQHHPQLENHFDPSQHCSVTGCQQHSLNYHGLTKCWLHCDEQQQNIIRRTITKYLEHFSWQQFVGVPRNAKEYFRTSLQEQQQLHQQQQHQQHHHDDVAKVIPHRVRSHEDLKSYMKMLYSSKDENQRKFELEFSEIKLHRSRQLIVQLVETKRVVEIKKKHKSIPISGKVKVLYKFCTSCNAWHEETDDVVIEVPSQEHVYYGFTQRERPDVEPIEDCGNDEGDWGSDFNEEEGPSLDDVAEFRHETDPLLERINPNHQRAPLEAWTVGTMKGCKIYSGKTDRVHQIAWSALSNSTRRQHIRILNDIQLIPSSQDNVTLVKAIVDMVLQKAADRGWKWSTISSYLASAASACRDLKLYSSQINGFDLRKDPYWNQVTSTAMRRAKQCALDPKGSAPLTTDQFEQLAKRLQHDKSDGWYLLLLSHYLAGRIGDVRRIAPHRIHVGLDDEKDDRGYVAVKVTFTKGKGVHFNSGPFTITTSMPRDRAQALHALVLERRNKGVEDTFTQKEQKDVSNAIKEMFGSTHSVRSIRRGRLVALAEAGMANRDLMLLTNHQRESTLKLYYLTHSYYSYDNNANVQKITDADKRIVNGGGEEVVATNNTKGMWMGRHSGLRAPSGRRQRPPPTLFGAEHPTREDLGLPSVQTDSEQVDKSDWKVHCPKVKDMVKSKELQADLQRPEMRSMMQQAEELRISSQHYGLSGRPLNPETIPISKFPRFAVMEMLKSGVVAPLEQGSDVMSAINGFLIDEPTKKRWRIITETLFNRTLDRSKLPSIGSRSGREIASKITNCRYSLEFDFSCYYSAIEIGPNKNCYVIRLKEPIEWDGIKTNLLVMTSSSMGSSVSAHVAVMHTLSVLEPLLKMDGLSINTMIDNVHLGHNDPDKFYQAVSTFLKRCDHFGFTLNDREKFDVNNKNQILQLGLEWAKGPSKFLGVMYQDKSVRNSEKNVGKFAEAWERTKAALHNNSIVVTKRNLASIISLSTWMAYNVGEPLSNHRGMLGLFSKLESSTGGWDERIIVTESHIGMMEGMAKKLLRNEWVIPFVPEHPSLSAESYDIAIICDACKLGGGAIVLVNGKMYEVTYGFEEKEVRESAYAEPMAASKFIRWAKERYYEKHPRNQQPSVALVTDHEALPQRQRRPLTARGGFSPNVHVNQFFKDIYGANGRTHSHVFFVEGIKNETDYLSRRVKLKEPLKYREIKDREFPSLSEFYHPYQHHGLDRPYWHV